MFVWLMTQAIFSLQVYPEKSKLDVFTLQHNSNRFCLSHLNHSFSDIDETGSSKDCVLELILSKKKTTWNDDYYEVHV